MFEWLQSLSRPKRWLTVGGAVVAFVAFGMYAESHHPRWPFGTSGEASAVTRPNPAEFLYLDNERVGAYLAQLNGGIAKSERLTEMLRTEEGAKAGGDLFAVSASAQHENFVERQVTPTAAANFFRLLSVLRQQEEIEDVSVNNLRDFERRPEGSFVFFHSRDLRTPIYANSYLVVRQAGTMKALFPTADMDYSEREAVEGVRESARSFAHQVGLNPRLVFSLTPKENQTEEEEREKKERKGSSEEKLEAKRETKNDAIKFLLPVRYEQLTDERSLIKDGGGSFRVVGKIVRVFKGREHKKIAYRDSPTWETWRYPLEHVPGELLKRSSWLCETAPDSGKVISPDSTEALRSCVLKRLKEQTEIPTRGAVILPIAIYK